MKKFRKIKNSVSACLEFLSLTSYAISTREQPIRILHENDINLSDEYLKLHFVKLWRIPKRIGGIFYHKHREDKNLIQNLNENFGTSKLNSH